MMFLKLSSLLGKMGIEYHGCGEEYNVEKSVNRKQYNLFYNFGKNITWGKWEEMNISGKKIKI